MQRTDEPRSPAHLSRPGVVVVDARSGFLDTMAGSSLPLLVRLEKLLLMAYCLELPTVATFEDP